MKPLLHAIFHAIFWLWNLTFLLVVYAGILPVIAPALIASTFAGQTPVEFCLTLVALIAVPTICTLIAIRYLRNQPVHLMQLFYGVEAPLFLLCLIRLFLLRELTPASAQIITTIVICIAAFFLELIYGYATRHRTLAWLQAIAHSLMLLTGVYVGVVLMFYAVPVAGAILREFVKLNWLGVFWYVLTHNILAAVWWIPILFILFGFTSTLFVAMPSALATLYVLSGREVLRQFASQYGKTRAWAGAGIAVTAWIVVFLSLQQQPQIQAFNLLNTSPGNDSSRQALLAKSDQIRQGLLNAYLLSYRYLSTREENNHIRSMYGSFLGLPEPIPEFLQANYNHLMSPFLYNGSRLDRDKAEKLYAQFFDAPIQKAERQAVQHALQSTFNQDEVKAGLLNINQEKVWLRSQQVTVEERGDWANVELYEVYENKTREVQEVLYYFSLPESAVITGLWLGESNNLADRFPFVIAPRGAAQQVYNQQVRRERPVDPALLEQVGPRQYRLRAFPIPAQVPSQRQQQQMHLWLTYKVMQQDSSWAMPQLSEKRNIFWNKDTKRIRNGQVIGSQKDSWLETFISTSRQQPTLHQVDFPEGYRISAHPLTQQDYALPQGKHFAIVLDSSRSMAAHVQQMTQTFRQLQAIGNNSNDIDLYVTASSGAAPRRVDNVRGFNLAKLTFYGTLQPKEMLRQFAQLHDNRSYDAILLVTDEGSYELANDSADLPVISAPLWVVHLGRLMPPAYDDATLQAIQDSGGGVATEILEVLQRVATQVELGSSVVNVVDGYAWSQSKFESQGVSENSFAPLAARQLVLKLSKAKRDQLAQLDDIHVIAKTFNIVTPYSSMLVLVNDQQREQLRRAEADKDRFNREVESGHEQLSQPSNPFTVSGVPEPEEWMLMGIVAIALLFIARKRRSTISS